MKIGPDGTLARITSTVKENNIIILKVPDTDKKKPEGPPYKLLPIGADKIDHDSASEISDDGTEEIEINSVKLNMENIKLGDEIQAEKEDHDKKVVKKTVKNQKHKSNKSQNNLQFKGFQSKKRFTRSHKHKSNISSSLSKNRNYNVSSKSGNKYKNSAINSAYNIDPWLSPQMMDNLHNVQIPIIQQYFPDMMQYRSNISLEPTMLSAATNSFVRLKPTSSVGLLGDSPYSPIPAQYLYNKQEHNHDHMWHDQGAVNNHNYWNKDYSNNFHRSVPIESSIPVEQNQINPYQSNRSYETWRGNRRKNTSRWIRNSMKKRKKWRTSKNQHQSTSRKGGYRPWHKNRNDVGIK